MSIGLALAVLTIALPLPPSTTVTTPPIPLLSAASSDSARAWSANRPNRGESRSASIVKRAATFPPAITDWASCVIDRESGGNLVERQSGVRAYNPSGAQGRWQFMSPWNHGGPYMVRDRLVQFGMPKADAREVREHLSSHPIVEWNGWWQDILMIEAVERGGAFHWDGPGC